MPTRSVVVAAFVVLCLIWGSTWLVIKEGLRELPALSGAAYRFTLAAAIFAIAAPWLHRLEGGERPNLRIVLTMGTLNFAAAYGIVYWAETVIPSGLASVLWGVFPMMMAFMGHAFIPGERIDRWGLAGFSVGLVGVFVLFATDLRGIGTDALYLGGVLLLSPAAAALGQTVIKRDGGRASATLLNRNAMFVGAGWLWVAALATENPLAVEWNRTAVLSVLYLAAFGTVVTFGIYYWLLRYVASSKLSLIAYVTPALALWLGWLVEDEPLHLSTFAGTGLVLGGIALVVHKRRGGADAG